jgi:hypothetical protein
MRLMSRHTVIALACQLAAYVALAHHAASGLYDRTATVGLVGEIVAVSWRNPHVHVSLAVPAAGGATDVWDVETGSVNTLERMGVTADEFRIGERMDVTGYAGRDGRKILFAATMVTATGESLPLGGGGGGDITQRYARPEQIAAGRALDSGPATDIFRVWVPMAVPNTGLGRTSFPLRPAARAARAAWNPANDPVLRCIPPGMPAAMDNPYPIAFERHGDDIVVRLEEWDGVRTIHMNPGAAAPVAPPSPLGYSVGRFEGDTLVVETDRIDYPYFDDVGTPQSAQLRMTERFTLLREQRRLTWEARVTDPLTFTEPVDLEIEWQWIPGHVIKPFGCEPVAAP